MFEPIYRHYHRRIVTKYLLFIWYQYILRSGFFVFVSVKDQILFHQVITKFCIFTSGGAISETRNHGLVTAGILAHIYTPI